MLLDVLLLLDNPRCEVKHRDWHLKRLLPLGSPVSLEIVLLLLGRRCS